MAGNDRKADRQRTGSIHVPLIVTTGEYGPHQEESYEHFYHKRLSERHPPTGRQGSQAVVHSRGSDKHQQNSSDDRSKSLTDDEQKTAKQTDLSGGHEPDGHSRIDVTSADVSRDPYDRPNGQSGWQRNLNDILRGVLQWKCGGGHRFSIAVIPKWPVSIRDWKSSTWSTRHQDKYHCSEELGKDCRPHLPTFNILETADRHFRWSDKRNQTSWISFLGSFQANYYFN